MRTSCVTVPLSVWSRSTTSWGIVPGASGVLRRGPYDGAGLELPAPQVLSQTQIRKAASLTAVTHPPSKECAGCKPTAILGLGPVPGAPPKAWNRTMIKFMG